MKKYEMVVERTDTGYSAYSADYPVGTTGGSIEELTENILEVMNFYFDEMELGKVIDAKDLKITLDMHQFFDYYNVIDPKALSKRINMDPFVLAEYINGAKKPSHAQTRKILLGIQKIGRELADVKFFL